MNTIELELPDMSCGHCVRAVTEALQALDAQARVQAEVPARRVSVQTSATAEAVRAALTEAGYPPAG